MSQYDRSHHIQRWKGTSEAIAQIAKLTLDIVRGATPNPDEEHHKVRLRIRVESPGVKDDFSSPGDFVADMESRDMATVESVDIHAGKLYDPPVDAHVRFARGFLAGVYIHVTGTDRTAVEGAITQVRELCEKGARRLQRLLEAATISLVVGFFLALVSIALRTSVDDSLRVTGALIAAWCGLAMASIGAVLGLAAWRLVPSLELLAPGQPSRWERYRKRVIAGASTLALLAVASVAEAVTGRLL